MNLMTYDLIKLAINFYISAVKNPYLWMTLRDFFFNLLSIVIIVICYITRRRINKEKFNIFISFFFYSFVR